MDVQKDARVTPGLRDDLAQGADLDHIAGDTTLEVRITGPEVSDPPGRVWERPASCAAGRARAIPAAARAFIARTGTARKRLRLGRE